MSARERPVLVYDGDCAFCTRSAALAEKLRPDAQIVAWQHTDLAALGLTEQQAGNALQWVGTDGAISSGHLAVAALLRRAGRIWTVPGRVLTWPGVSPVAARTYRFVADHRDRMPGGTAACALPPERRPGASSPTS